MPINRDMYLALGDSLTTGYAVGQNNSFASLYYSALSPQFLAMRYINLGINGLTSGRLAMLLQRENIQQLVRRARLITVTIGSNDLLSIAKAQSFSDALLVDRCLNNLSQGFRVCGQYIRSLNPDAQVKVATIYNPLPAGPFQQFALPAQGIFGAANQIINHCAAGYNFGVVPVAQAFQGREKLLIGGDFFHPNLAGHQVMAQQFIQF